MNKAKWNIGIIFGICLVMAAFTGKMALSFVLLCWVVIAFSALIYYRALPKELPVKIDAPASVKKGEQIQVSFEVEQEGRLPIFDGLAVLTVKSLLYGTEEKIELPIALAGNEEGSAPFSIDTRYMGVLEIRLESTEYYDFFRWMKKRKEYQLIKEVLVLPETYEPNVLIPDVSSIDYEGEKLEEAPHGFDPGLYQGIRPYREGDLMKNIHWKLTEKLGQYVVRELGIPTGKKPYLYLETTLNKVSPREIDYVLEQYFSLSQCLLQQGIAHILCWNSVEYPEQQERKIENIEMLDQAMECILRTPFIQKKNALSTKEAIRYMSPQKDVVYVYVKEGKKERMVKISD